MRVLATALPIALVLASGSALSDEAVVALGKQRAAASTLQWEIREANHPILGRIRFAHLKSAVVTPVGNAKVYSSAYVSCELDAHRIAIELTNQVAPDDPGGLRPASLPRLVCDSPSSGNAAKSGPEEVDARWQVSDIGDALARGLGPWTLHSCASIGVMEEVSLPKGWAQPTASIRFDITPYAKELDSIFTTCGVMSAYANDAATKSGASSQPRTEVASADGGWTNARTVPHWRSFVHAKPNVRSPVVARLAPSSAILVERAGADWWRAKSRYGWNWTGYIRQDRLILAR